jgi:hypothetical protein
LAALAEVPCRLGWVARYRGTASAAPQLSPHASPTAIWLIVLLSRG